MKRDIIVDIFLGGLLLSLLFVFSFPVLFAYNANIPREISLAERMMSVCFVLAFFLTTVWACWKKKIWVALGLAMYALLPYIPKWFLPKVYMDITLDGRNIVNSLLSSFLNRIYELTHAPFAGLIGMVSEKTADKMAYKLLPLVIIGYLLAQIVHFYYNAYVTEKKQKHDFAHFRRAQAHRVPVMPAAVPVAEPLGTVVKDENNEIAKETYSANKEEMPTMKMAVEVPESTQVIKKPETVPAIEATSTDTQVISLAANAPTSKGNEETQVIALSGQAPTSKPAEGEPEVVALSAQAPTSKPAVQEDYLDFPDIRGEAEKIDVFGDDES